VAYLNFVNFNINLRGQPRGSHHHFWRDRPTAVTAMGQDDFRHGRAVDGHRRPVPAHFLGPAQVGLAPARPDPRWRRAEGGQRGSQLAPASNVHANMPRQLPGGRDAAAPAVRDQLRAEQEQRRLQRDAERTGREQQRQQEIVRQQADVRAQREQLLRQQQQQAARIGGAEQRTQRSVVQAPQPDPAQREAWMHQREQARAQREAEQAGRGLVQQSVQPVVQPRQIHAAPERPMQFAAPPQQAPVQQPHVQQPHVQHAAPIGRVEGGWQREAEGDGVRQGGNGGGHWRH
jgi:hypothetical protein